MSLLPRANKRTISLIATCASILFASPVGATDEADSMRMFFYSGELNGEVEDSFDASSEKLGDSASHEELNSAVGASAVLIESNSTETRVPPDVQSNRKKHFRSYYYNGFISSPTGNHYFVNGMSLNELHEIRLVAVKDSGGSLAFKAKDGQRFTLEVGQTKKLPVLPRVVKTK